MCTKVESQSKRESENEITEDEALLYDRQIRLWGVEAQRKLRNAKVLLIGLSAVGSEITKNLVLCGIDSLTVVDDQTVTIYDSLSHLFTQRALGENRGKASEANIKSLNPRVKVNTEQWNIAQMIDNRDKTLVDILRSVDVVCITNFDSQTILKLNTLYRELNNDNVKFYAVCTWGFFGYSFTDLGKNHKYIVEEVVQAEVEICDEPNMKKIKAEEQNKSFFEKNLSYVPFETFLSIKAGKAGVGITKRTNPGVVLSHILFKFYSKHNRYPSPSNRAQDVEELKSLQNEVVNELGVDEKMMSKLNKEEWWNNVFGEISPVCAIVGGVVGQDIIRAISAQDTPIKNLFLFDGLQCNGHIESLGK
ncbi:SUMO-activating enzyme subunit 1-like protein [Dinothrombium tinctorium]|uniref:SUMO-activating enzyme subunit 1 n=1 Tax=Dinothrombium tinctorium TaxID=1965070 RepID=A0A3S3S4L9_9ACAR|nr:SUMO-activating enzyme subunit 1-like protein [Dinothrombium tinctorium]